MSAEALEQLLAGDPVEDNLPDTQNTPDDEGVSALEGMLEQDSVFDAVGDSLPTRWKVYNPATLWDDEAENFDWGEIDKQESAFLVGMGHMMSDTYNGLNQMAIEQGWSDDQKKLAKMQADENLVNKLYEDPRFKNSASSGAIVGALVEPAGVTAGFLMPTLKASSLLKVAGIGAITGGLFTGAGYVDRDSDETRLKNTLFGMAVGGLLSTTVVGAAKGISAGYGKTLAKTADNQLSVLEAEISHNRLIKGMRKKASVQKAYDDLELTDAMVADMVIKSSRKTFSSKKATNIQQGTDILESWQALSTKQRAKMRGRDRIIPPSVEEFITPLTSVLTRISPKVGATVKNAVAKQYVTQGNWLHKTHDLRKAMADIKDKATVLKLNKALITQDFTTAKKIMGANGISGKQFQTAIDVYKEAGESLKASGYKIPILKNYWHRAVENPDLIASIEDKGLQKLIAKGVADNGGRSLSPQQMTKVIQNFSMRPDQARFKTGSALKRRVKKDIDDQMMSAYYRPEQALEYYIMQASDDISRAKVFKSLGHQAKLQLDGSDAEKIIDDLATKDWARNPEDSAMLRKGLRALYVDANKPAMRGIRAFKNITYAMTLGNPFSAATQAGDVIFSAHKFGIMNATRSLLGKKRIKREDLGIVDATLELADIASKSKYIADWALKLGGFHHMDKLGKETFINAAYRSAKKLAKDPKAFKKQFEKTYGKETDDLLSDLNNDVVSDNVKMMLFNELSEVQPISLAEMPIKYLQYPSGRVLYMMRSFTIKQFDYMRKIIQKKESGYERAKDLTKFMALFVMANGSIRGAKDYMRGKDTEPEAIVLDTAVSMIGLNKYSLESAAREGVGKAAGDWLLPPMTAFDKPVRAIGKAVVGEGDVSDAFKETIYSLPVVGDAIEAYDK